MAVELRDPSGWFSRCRALIITKMSALIKCNLVKTFPMIPLCIPACDLVKRSNLPKAEAKPSWGTYLFL